MIRSRHFWAGAIMLAVIPMLVLDISEHYIAWQKEVREPIIEVVQNFNNVGKAQKAEILDRVFEKNSSLIQRSVFKGSISIVLLLIGIYQLSSYAKSEKPLFLKPALIITGLIITFMAFKISFSMAVNTEPGANFITVNAGENSFKSIINKNFKGKVVYVDFWGTTCGPCLLEFDNFTHPVKEHYKNRKDIAYLYVANGNRYFWKKQIAKHKVDGNHLFLEDAEYVKLYHEALNNATATVTMPRYLIVDKAGNVAVADASRPSDSGKLYSELDKYLK